MAGRKKGTEKTGGRSKGTPNKVSSDIKARLQAIIDGYDLEGDLDKLEPQQRITIMERLMQYAIPKMQSVSIDAQIASEYAELSKLLLSAPEEAINEIANRMQTLNEFTNEN